MRSVFLVLVFVFVGCGSPSPGPVRSLGPGEMAIPTFESAGWACGGFGFVDQQVLHGDPSDPRVAWLVDPGGERTDVAWLSGSSARFSPELEILDPAGLVIAHEGSVATGGCPSPDLHGLFVDFQVAVPERTEPPMTVEP